MYRQTTILGDWADATLLYGRFFSWDRGLVRSILRDKPPNNMKPHRGRGRGTSTHLGVHLAIYTKECWADTEEGTQA